MTVQGVGHAENDCQSEMAIRLCSPGSGPLASLNDCNDLPEVADDLIHQPRALIQLERGARRSPNVN